MFKRILIPVDGSSTSNRALAAGIVLAQQFGSRMRLVHVVDEAAYLAGYDLSGGYSGDLIRAMREAGERILGDATKTAQAAGVETETTLFDTFGERLGETVAKAAKLWNADLVVVGTHGRRGFSRLLMGSGAEQVIRLAPVPVLVVRADEEITPQEK
jgi:nucleotide-binding universal stress UspA family protein